MTDMREDVLAALPAAARIRREREDADYLTNHTEIYADPESLKKGELNTWVGTDALKKADLKPVPAGAKLDFCVCAVCRLRRLRLPIAIPADPAERHQAVRMLCCASRPRGPG